MMSHRSEEMKFTGRILSLIAEMNDVMDDAMRALDHEDIGKVKTCMALITLHSDEILNILTNYKEEN